MVPITSPTLTVSPSPLAMVSSTPSCSASTSKLILSVSSSTSGSPDFTSSPSCLSQRPTVASATDSPSSGTCISTATFHLFLSVIFLVPGASVARAGGARLRPLGCRLGLLQPPIDVLERRLDYLRVLLFVEARRALGRAGPGWLADVVDRHFAAGHLSEARFHERPGPHVLRLLLDPEDLTQVGVAFEHLPHPFFGEGVEQLYPGHSGVHCLLPVVAAHELGVDLARAQDEPLHGVGPAASLLVVQDRLEFALGEVREVGGGHWVPQEALRGHDYEGPLVGPEDCLAPQQVKVLGRRGQVGHPYVLVRREL